MENQNINSGVKCEVTDCTYHTANDKCSAEKIEVCNCTTCSDKSNETFCATYHCKNIK